MDLTIIRRQQSVWQTLKPAVFKLQSLFSMCTLIILLILFVLTLLIIMLKPLNKVINVIVIETDQPPLHVTNSKFLSIALDSSMIAEGFPHFNMTNPHLLKLMAPLAPGYLRIGGTMADRLWFTAEDNYKQKLKAGSVEYCCSKSNLSNFTMSGLEWLELNQLTNSAGLTILFDLNCLIRFDDGSWNSTNAEELISFSNNHSLNVIWELGNEPNLFKHVFNYEVNATQLAKDFIKVRQILNRYPLYKYSLLVGPDTTRPTSFSNKSQKYLQEFLGVAGDVIDAVTWHQYYFDGRTADAGDFLNPQIFDALKYQIQIIKRIVSKMGVESIPIWLGETSSAYGGGSPLYSNKYISTFIWLDKLGLAARNGLDLVVRQTLFGGNYALIDNQLQPAPDWWISVIYKHLVGPQVVPCYTLSSNMVRFYCHCTQKKSYYNVLPSVTVFGMNMQNTEARIRIDNFSSYLLEYLLTPYGFLTSKYIMLNDEVLYLSPYGNLPLFKPRIVISKPYLIIPPFSTVFWVIPVTVSYCQL